MNSSVVLGTVLTVNRQVHGLIDVFSLVQLDRRTVFALDILADAGFRIVILPLIHNSAQVGNVRQCSRDGAAVERVGLGILDRSFDQNALLKRNRCQRLGYAAEFVPIDRDSGVPVVPLDKERVCPRLRHLEGIVAPGFV